ncbi:hypothetical protein A9Q86_12855 [Flavobacteriales bacterium 33_180_T64]|nr:hypothetical protein A9Q86_12855 [Flavobacteriales bacterium 33_180_T64]
MKKITLLFILCIISVSLSYSQCTDSTIQWPTGIVTVLEVSGAQTISNDNWPDNEFSLLTGLVIGESYTISTNLTTYITVTEPDGMTIITHGLDSVSFTATTTDIVCYWTLDSLCNTQNNRDTITQIECTTCNACTATATPDAVIEPTPANMSIDIAITGITITPFSWIEDTVNPADSFNLSIGLTTTGDDIGTVFDFANGNGLNYTWAYNTTYYWKVESVNCMGSTTSAVWSFTTTSCTATASPDLAVSPMPADSAINIPINDVFDPGNLVVGPFSWTEAITGDLANSYNLSLGLTTSGDDLGVITGATNGNYLTFTWAYDTTYYWKVDAVNCFGTATGTVWSFTTEANPTLSITEFNTDKFSVYPNPAESFVIIKNISPYKLENVSLYDIRGSHIKTYKLNNNLEVNQIYVSNLQVGVYVFVIQTEQGQLIKRLVKE